MLPLSIHYLPINLIRSYTQTADYCICHAAELSLAGDYLDLTVYDIATQT